MSKRALRILAISVAVFCAQALFAPSVRSGWAQGRFADESAGRLPSGLGGASAVAVGDFNGDGSPDIFLVGPQRDILLLNDGAGVFAESDRGRLPARLSAGVGAAATDIDRDGDLDILIASGKLNRVLINSGSGFFADETRQRVPASKLDAQGVAAGDVDADGDADLFFANQNRLLINNGSGRFSEIPFPALSDLAAAGAFADLDGDGDLDLVVATTGQNRVFIKAGRGFAEETNPRLPMVRDHTRGLALADLDGDGDVDIVFGNFGQNRVLMNDGAGHFTDETTSRLPIGLASTRKVIASDLDRDGDADLLVLNSEGTRLLVNDGAGRFSDQTAQRMPLAPEGGIDAALADFNGDGAPDMVLVSAERLFVFTNSAGPLSRAPAISGGVLDQKTGRGRGDVAVSSGEFKTATAPDGRFSLAGMARGDDGSVRVDIEVPPPSFLRILSPVEAPGGSVDFAPTLRFSWVDVSLLGAASYRVDYFFADRGEGEDFDSTEVDGTELVMDFSGSLGRAFFGALASIGPMRFRVIALDARGDAVDQTDFVELRLNPVETEEAPAAGAAEPEAIRSLFKK